MNDSKNWLLHPPTTGPGEIILVRIMAGSVFLWEGVLKFVYANQGVGRFTKLGFPEPGLTADFVGAVEIAGGLLLLFGLLTRAAALVFVIEMLVAMLSTKFGVYLGTSPLPLPPSPPQVGLWAVLHEIRSEWAQLFSVLFLAAIGPGSRSLDAVLARRLARRAETRPMPAALAEVTPRS
jgi:putative oxidoreductase